MFGGEIEHFGGEASPALPPLDETLAVWKGCPLLRGTIINAGPGVYPAATRESTLHSHKVSLQDGIEQLTSGCRWFRIIPTQERLNAEEILVCK